MRFAQLALARFQRLSARILPRGWLDALWQLALFAIAYYAYRIVRGAVDGRTATAFQNARDLVDIERSLGLFFEQPLQDWAIKHGFFEDAASWMYVNSHFVITVTFIVWLYLFRNQAYYFVRNMFMIAMSVALVLYVAYPTAPPRFFREWGFTDSVAAFVGDSAANSAGALYNPYAAVPSMHVAFALMIAVPAILLLRPMTLKVLWAIYPMLVTFAVMATGNHWWLDAVFGAATAGLAAWGAAFALARLRPEAWAFPERVRAEAPA